jgi:5-methylcytosine-specific restriction protein A
METLLLAWNPERFPWGDLRAELEKVKRDGRATDRWSVGNRRYLEPGARFFLMRLGSEPRGIVGSGWTTSQPFDAPHWDVEKADRDATARYVDIVFDTLAESPLISMDDLSAPPFLGMHWPIRMSGVEIPAHVAEKLEILWSARTRVDTSSGREELQVIPKLAEGHAERVYVNRYERNPRARALCLARYGLRCAACNVLMREAYGEAAEDLIHVHHLRPLSEMQGEYTIDPERDLRPVCPNCHAVIHSRNPPYTIEDIATMISDRKK